MADEDTTAVNIPVETTEEAPVAGEVTQAAPEAPEATVEPEQAEQETVPPTESVPPTPPVTDATTNTTGLTAAVAQPVTAPQVPAGEVSDDGPTARNNLLATGELIEGALAHLNNTKNIHHDVAELEAKLKEARQWIADELDVPLTIFGNAAAGFTDSTDNAPAVQ